jgi:hypothetical protein
MQRAVAAAGEAAGLDKRIHCQTLRHSFVARSGRTHRVEFASKCSAQRTHRPKNDPALAVPRHSQERHQRDVEGLKSHTDVETVFSLRAECLSCPSVLMSPNDVTSKFGRANEFT